MNADPLDLIAAVETLTERGPADDGQDEDAMRHQATAATVPPLLSSRCRTTPTMPGFFPMPSANYTRRNLRHPSALAKVATTTTTIRTSIWAAGGALAIGMPTTTPTHGHTK